MKSKKAVIAFIALSLLSVVSYAQNMVTSKEQQGLEKSIRYDVSKFTDTRDRKLEDVMKKMPGISVESWGGNSGYTYNGMGVEKIYVNGLDILGDDNSPVNNMKPEDVEFIEIIENHVTEKVMKGLQYSNSAAINVILKESAHTGWTGAVKAGAGVKPWLYNTDFNAINLGSKATSTVLFKADNTGLNLSGNSDNEWGNWGGGDGAALPQFLNVSPSMAPLSDQRVRFNNSMLGSLGTTLILGKDYSLNMQVSYGSDRLTASSLDQTTYYLDKGETVVDEVGEDALSKQRTLNVSSTLLSNTEKKFLQNKLNFSSDWRTVDKDITGSFPSDQAIKTTPTELTDELQYKVPLGNNVLSIDFQGEFKTKPQHLDILKEGNEFSQKIHAKSVSGDLSASYNIRFGKFNSSLKAGISDDIREIRTDMKGAIGIADGKNESTLNRFRIHGEASLTYINDKFQATLSFPVKWADYRMKDLIQDTVSTGAKFYISPAFEAKYQMTDNLSFNVGVEYDQDEMNRNILYPGLIFKDFRTASRGTSLILGDTETEISAGFAFRHPQSSLFISGQIRHGWEKEAFTGVMDFTDNYIISGYAEDKTGIPDKSTMFEGEISKGIGFLKGKIALGAFGMSSTASIIRNNAVINYHSRSLGIFPTINGRVLSWCNINYNMNINWNWMKMSDDETTSSSKDYTQTLEMIFSPWEKFNFSFLGEHYHTEFSEGQAKNLVLTDFKAEYTINPQWVIMAAVTNILNQKTYNYTLVDDNEFSKSYTSYAIRPRNVLLSVYHKF